MDKRLEYFNPNRYSGDESDSTNKNGWETQPFFNSQLGGQVTVYRIHHLRAIQRNTRKPPVFFK